MRVIHDEPMERRLELAAPPRSTAELAPRVLVTVLVMLLVGLVLAVARAVPVALWAAIPMALVMARWLVRRPEPVVEALVVRDGRLEVRVRGVLTWGRSTYVFASPTHGEPLRVFADGVGHGGATGAELGIRLSFPAQGTTPQISIEGVDRFDEVEALVHLIAHHLGLRVAVIDPTYGWGRHVGASGELPQPPKRAPGAYRDAPRVVGLDAARTAGFELPAGPVPSLAQVDGSELRGRFERTSGGERVHPESPLPLLLAVLALSSASGVVTLALGASTKTAMLWAMLLPLCLAITVAVRLLGSLLASSLHGLARLTSGKPSGVPRPPTFGWASGFDLVGDRLTLRWRRGTFERGRPGRVLLVTRFRSSELLGTRSWRELWIHDGRTWSFLARSRVERKAGRDTPTLDALAFEIGRRLDWPVRSA